MACLLLGARPLPKPVLVLLTGPLGINFSENVAKPFHLRIRIWKYGLQNDDHFDQRVMSFKWAAGGYGPHNDNQH